MAADLQIKISPDVFERGNERTLDVFVFESFDSDSFLYFITRRIATGVIKANDKS